MGLLQQYSRGGVDISLSRFGDVEPVADRLARERKERVAKAVFETEKPETKIENIVSPETKIKPLKSRGRPSSGDSGDPWVAAGMSRAAWYRARKSAEAKP